MPFNGENDYHSLAIVVRAINLGMDRCADGNRKRRSLTIVVEVAVPADQAAAIAKASMVSSKIIGSG